MEPSFFDIDLEKLNCYEITKQVLRQLLNHIEYQHKEILSSKRENQELKDEINRLKGEKGKQLLNSLKQQDLPKVKFRKNYRWNQIVLAVPSEMEVLVL